MMKAFSSASFLALLSVLVLAGCGQKGPLFLPGEAPEAQTQGPLGLDGQRSDTPASAPTQPADHENADTQP